MSDGIRTLIYPVRSIEQTKSLLGIMLGSEPYVDTPYDVGFRTDGTEIGLDPDGHSQGMTGPVPYSRGRGHQSDVRLAHRSRGGECPRAQRRGTRQADRLCQGCGWQHDRHHAHTVMGPDGLAALDGPSSQGRAMEEIEWVSGQFQADRSRLEGMAYRMLGSRAEAEEAVQEAWLKVMRADRTAVENLSGWLTTVTARVCLDRLRSRGGAAGGRRGNRRSRSRGLSGGKRSCGGSHLGGVGGCRAVGGARFLGSG